MYENKRTLQGIPVTITMTCCIPVTTTDKLEERFEVMPSRLDELTTEFDWEPFQAGEENSNRRKTFKVRDTELIFGHFQKA